LLSKDGYTGLSQVDTPTQKQDLADPPADRTQPTALTAPSEAIPPQPPLLDAVQ